MTQLATDLHLAAAYASLNFIAMNFWSKELPMRRTLPLILSLSLFALPVQADDTRPKAYAEEILAMTNAQSIMDGIISNLRRTFDLGVERLKVPAEKQKIVEEYSERLDQLLAQNLKWQDIQTELVNSYTQFFTEQELAEIANFYKSPLGQKMIDTMPKLMQQAALLGQQQVRQTLPEIQGLTQEMLGKLQSAN
jgi:hypothetical protein